jgi:uracil-DNA glycosylase
MRVLASYHPSLQNTNTGKLTRPMFLDIFRRARKLAGLTLTPVTAPSE